MVAHLTEIEKAQVDRCTRRNKGTVTEAWEAVNRRRARQFRTEPITRGPVYRYVRGMTHKRNTEETRGRPKLVTGAMLRGAFGKYVHPCILVPGWPPAGWCMPLL